VAEDIREVYISPAMNAKINDPNHQLTADDVLHACWKRTHSSWAYDEERGWRLYVEGRTEFGVPVIVVLYPTTEPGLWNLGTARRA
jgi:hypothetical protein